ncbi:hypothetical protein GDO78_002302 [Eleutherodactylus coqui]|uniref:Uncharacterized protein n=1 Tax=Eleutherodactylus coqui TaxID=57060 RepID=A0A8J6K0T2_ELECQ|nr:hypothetical protein GDO78_002302 [Eleutherodactylus coqui]
MGDHLMLQAEDAEHKRGVPACLLLPAVSPLRVPSYYTAECSQRRMQNTSGVSPLVFCIQQFSAWSARLLYSRALRAGYGEQSCTALFFILGL